MSKTLLTTTEQLFSGSSSTGSSPTSGEDYEDYNEVIAQVISTVENEVGRILHDLRLPIPERKRLQSDCSSLIETIKAVKDPTHKDLNALHQPKTTLATWLADIRNEQIDYWILVHICNDISKDLEDLHNADQVYGHLEPDNIEIVVEEGVPRAKLELFCASGTHESSQTSNEDRLKWLAPEVEEDKSNAGYHGDLFSLGLVLAFTMSKGKHIFGEKGNPNDTRIRQNILDLNVNWQILKEPQFFLLKNLLSSLLIQNTFERVSIRVTLEHPFFWTPEKCLDFLSDVCIDVESDDCVKSATELECNTVFENFDWLNFITKSQDDICKELAKELHRVSKSQSLSISTRSILDFIRLFPLLKEEKLPSRVVQTLIEKYSWLVAFFYNLFQDPCFQVLETEQYYDYNLVQGFSWDTSFQCRDLQIL